MPETTAAFPAPAAQRASPTDARQRERQRGQDTDAFARSSRLSASEWSLLWFLALGIRLPSIWLVANAHGDAYSYADAIAEMSAKLSAGSFALPDFFGFWLPLYQFASALLVSASGMNPMIAGKTVSVLCGVASAIMVFDLTVKLTRSRRWAWLAFWLLLLEPGHAFLSALSMTEASHSLLVLAVVRYAALGRWHAAAWCGALAGLVRIDSWIFLPLLPALQYARERRISFPSVLCLLMAPLAWLAISYAARGDAFAYFSERAKYVQAYLEFEPSRRGYSFLWQDVFSLVTGAHTVVFPLALLATGLILWRFPKCACHRGNVEFAAFALAATFGGMLCFLLLAYIARSQPVIWDRYGTIFFVLGLPMAAWWLQQATRTWKATARLRRAVTALLLGLCLTHAVGRATGAIIAVADDVAHQRIAAEVRRIATEEGWSGPPAPNETLPARCFCDDPAVRVVSRIPSSRFLRTPGNENVSSLPEFLDQQGARYVVLTNIENSLPVKLAPELARAATPSSRFKLLRVERSPWGYGSDVRLYEMTDDDEAEIRDGGRKRR